MNEPLRVPPHMIYNVDGIGSNHPPGMEDVVLLSDISAILAAERKKARDAAKFAEREVETLTKQLAEVREMLDKRIAQLRKAKQKHGVGIGDRAALTAAINALTEFKADVVTILGEEIDVDAAEGEGRR